MKHRYLSLLRSFYLIIGIALILHPVSAHASTDVAAENITPSEGFKFQVRLNQVEEGKPFDITYEFVKRTQAGTPYFSRYRIDRMYIEEMTPSLCRIDKGWEDLHTFEDLNPATTTTQDISFATKKELAVLEGPAHFRVVPIAINPLRTFLGGSGSITNEAIQSAIGKPLACTSGEPLRPPKKATLDGRVRMVFDAVDIINKQRISNVEVSVTNEGKKVFLDKIPEGKPLVLIYDPSTPPNGLKLNLGYTISFSHPQYKEAKTSQPVFFGIGSDHNATMAKTGTDLESTVKSDFPDNYDEFRNRQTPGEQLKGQDCSTEYLKILKIQILKFATCQIQNTMLLIQERITSLIKLLKI